MKSFIDDESGTQKRKAEIHCMSVNQNSFLLIQGINMESVHLKVKGCGKGFYKTIHNEWVTCEECYKIIKLKENKNVKTITVEVECKQENVLAV